MISPSPISAIACLGLLLSGAAGVAITKENSLMRAESRAVELKSSGQMKKDVSLVEEYEEYEDASAGDDDMCNMDFPFGKDECECEDGHVEMDEAECQEAARQAGAHTTVRFVLTDPWTKRHPRGCFKFPCKDTGAPTGEWIMCYYFNPITEQVPACGGEALPNGCVPPVKGTKVCKRPKLSNSTADTNDGCGDGYGVIYDEETCRAAATCMGHCIGSEFITHEKNQSRYDLFPDGCFLDTREHSDGCVYYNEPIANRSKPTSPKGTAICNVTNITDVRAERAPAGTDWNSLSGGIQCIGDTAAATAAPEEGATTAEATAAPATTAEPGEESTTAEATATDAPTTDAPATTAAATGE